MTTAKGSRPPASVAVEVDAIPGGFFDLSGEQATKTRKALELVSEELS